jgi:hypothetical protein
MACEVRTVKLSIIGLSCLQKLISHDAVSPSALREILSTLKDVSLKLVVILYYGFKTYSEILPLAISVVVSLYLFFGLVIFDCY